MNCDAVTCVECQTRHPTDGACGCCHRKPEDFFTFCNDCNQFLIPDPENEGGILLPQTARELIFMTDESSSVIRCHDCCRWYHERCGHKGPIQGNPLEESWTCAKCVLTALQRDRPPDRPRLCDFCHNAVDLTAIDNIIECAGCDSMAHLSCAVAQKGERWYCTRCPGRVHRQAYRELADVLNAADPPDVQPPAGSDDDATDDEEADGNDADVGDRQDEDDGATGEKLDMQDVHYLRELIATRQVIDVGDLKPCDRCGAQIFSFENKKGARICCGTKKPNRPHQFNFGDVIHFDVTTKALYEKHASVLASESRMVNAWCSVASIGVESYNEARDAVDILGGMSVIGATGQLMAQGLPYHFPVGSINDSRCSRLQGCAQSYFFSEPDTSQLLHEVRRFASNPDQVWDPNVEFLDAVTCIKEFREYLSVNNNVVRELRSNFRLPFNPDPQTTIISAASIPQLVLTYETSGSVYGARSTSRDHLTLLYNVRGFDSARPSTSAVATGQPGLPLSSDWKKKFGTHGELLLEAPFESVRYQTSVYPLLYPRGVPPHWSPSHSRSKEVCLHRRKDLLAMSLQSDFFKAAPAVADQLILDVMSTQQKVNALSALKAMETRPNTRRTSLLRVQAESRLKDGRTFRPDPSPAGGIPESVRGSPAEKLKHTSEGMASVEAEGHPDIFATATANSSWADITRNLPWMTVNGVRVRQPYYRHMHIVNRVFKRKLDLLITALKAGLLFGGRKAKAIQYKIEWQKRGLPHAHILITFHKKFDAAEITNYITARTPKPCESHGLDSKAYAEECAYCRYRNLVLESLVHSCRAGRCWPNGARDKTCKYNFPFAPLNRAKIGPRGRWLYPRSREDAHIVPHSEEICYLMNCHVNVEACFDTRAVCYLRKYFSKSADTVAVKAKLRDRTMNSQQATLCWMKCRHYGASEGYWDLYNYPIDYYWPKVESVKIHLPGTERLYDVKNREAAETMLRLIPSTSVWHYFCRPDRFDNTTFDEFYRWHTVKAWKPRGDAEHPPELNWVRWPSANVDLDGIDRRWLSEESKFQENKFYVVGHRRSPVDLCYRNVRPNNAPLQSLKALLKHVPGRSFKDLLKIPPDFGIAARRLLKLPANATHFQTFQQAADARGLFFSDGLMYHVSVLREMIEGEQQHPRECARYFYSFLTFGSGNDFPDVFLTLFGTCIPTDVLQEFRTEHGATDDELFYDSTNYVRGLPVPPLWKKRLLFEAILMLADVCKDDGNILSELLHDKLASSDTTDELRTAVQEAEAFRLERMRQEQRRQAEDSSADYYSRLLTRMESMPDASTAEDNQPHFTDEQKIAYDDITSKAVAFHSLNSAHSSLNTAPHFYINGDAGTGKTFLLTQIHRALSQKGLRVVATAFTGIAASLLPMGQTAHSTFKIPVDECDECDVNPKNPIVKLGRITTDSYMGAVIRDADVLITDEVPMMQLHLLSSVDSTTKQLCDHRAPFAGKMILFAGDFQQTSPVVKGLRSSEDEVVDSLTLKYTVLAHDVFKNPSLNKYRLTKPLRFSTSPQWPSILKSIAKGEVGRADPLFPELSSHLHIDHDVLTPYCKVCPSIDEAMEHYREYCREHNIDRKRTALQLLAPVHETVKEFNERCFEEFFPDPRQYRTYHATYDRPRGRKHQAVNYVLGEEQFSNLDTPREPPHMLKLGPGCIIMLLRNIRVTDGMSNGALFVVLETHNNYLKVTPYITDPLPPAQQKTFIIFRIRTTMTFENVEFVRMQFPVRLAYAATINKAQGKTLTTPSIVSLTHDCFMHGQLYVGLSRHVDPKLITIVSPPRFGQEANDCGTIVSYVNRQILSSAQV